MFRFSRSDLNDDEVIAFVNREWNNVKDAAVKHLRSANFSQDRFNNRYRNGRNIRRAKTFPVSSGRARRGFYARGSGAKFSLLNRVDYVQFIEASNNKRMDRGQYLKAFFENDFEEIVEDIYARSTI